jgi:hypothetical protein
MNVAGGYTWTKIPNVRFDNNSIVISKMPDDVDWDEMSQY